MDRDQDDGEIFVQNRAPLSLAIIIPYYQRQAGILRRCLASVVAQKLNSVIKTEIVIVDDASPRSVAEELRDMQIPKEMTVEVIRRDNGGPGAARNSGLDHISRRTDFIAFIDSDDTWTEDHIQRAVTALGNSDDLYFSNHLQWEGANNFDKREFGTFIRSGQCSTARPHRVLQGVWVCSNADVIPYAIKEFIAHTSSIVYRTSKFYNCRFDEELWYGEDDIFLLDLLFSSTRTCISSQAEVVLGLGDNIFFGSWSWESENNIKRCYYQFLTYKKIRRRYQLNSELHKWVTRIIRSWRPTLTFFMIRRLLRGRAVPLGLLFSLVREDPLFVATFPLNIMVVAVLWVVGKHRGIHAFHEK